MRIVFMTMTALALVACQKTDAAPTADAATDVVVANDAMANAATPAAFEIKSTSWEFVDNKSKKPIQESIDADGNYIASSGAEHIDHGTAVMKGGKACFTSAMTKEGEVCWTAPAGGVDASSDIVSDKGEKLTVKQVAYVAQKM